MLLLPQHKRRNILEINLTSNPELGWGVDKKLHKPHPEHLWKTFPGSGGARSSFWSESLTLTTYKRMGEPNLSLVGVSSVIHHFLPGSSVQLTSGANQGKTKIDVCVSKSRRQMDLLSSKLSLSLEKQERKCTKDL